MLIRKTRQPSSYPENSINDSYSTSQTDTYSCNYINSLETYSTSETRVGTWIDGKPIYRKVFTNLSFGAPANAWNNTGANISNVDTLTGCTAIRTSNKTIANSIRFRVNNNNNLECYPVSESFTGCNIIIAEYTKTTD